MTASGSRPAPPSSTPTQTPTTAYPDFVDYVTRWLLPTSRRRRCYGGGLRVQTTLDPTVQADAYAAVRSTLSGTSPTPGHGPGRGRAETGFVPALVGGRGFGHGTSPGQPGPRRLRPPPRGRAPRSRWRPPAGPAKTSPGAATAGSPARRGSRSCSPPPSSRASSPRHDLLGARRLPDPRLHRCRPASRPAPARSTTTNPAASSAPRPLAQATVGVDQHRLRPGRPPGGLQQRGHHGQEARDRVRLLLHSALLLLPELRPRRAGRLPARHGVRLRRLRRPRPAGRARPRSSRSSTAPARCSSTTSSPLPATTTGPAGQRGRQRHQRPAGRHLRRHRDRRPAGPAGRR